LETRGGTSSAGTASLNVGRLCEKRAVMLNRARSGVTPGPPINNALTPGSADAIAKFWIIKRDAQHGGECFAIAGRNNKRSFVVIANNLGQCSTTGGNEGNAAAHGFDGRQREAFIQRRNNGDLGLGIELNDAFFGDASNERDGIAKTKFVDDPSRWAAFFQATDDNKLDVAFCSEFGDGLEKIAKTLHRYVSASSGDEAPRDARNAGNGLEQFLINADGYDVQAIKRHFLVGMNISE